MSDERFWGPIGGWLKGLRWRRGRYGAAEGQGGVKSASTRAVGQARKQFAVAGRRAYDEVAGRLIITIQYIGMQMKNQNLELICNLLRSEIVKGHHIHIYGKPGGGECFSNVTQVVKPNIEMP